jgi:hypothetical protein
MTFSQAPAKICHPLGLVLEKLGRDAEALDAFRRFLAEVPENERSPALSKKLGDKVNELSQRLTLLKIDAPPKLTITVDGRIVGQSPLPREVAVAAGSRMVQAASPEFGTVSLRIAAQAGRTQNADLTKWANQNVGPTPGKPQALLTPPGQIPPKDVNDLPDGNAKPKPLLQDEGPVKKVPRWGLFGAGVAVFGAGYATSALVDGLCPSYRCQPPWVHFIPVLGPFIGMGTYNDPEYDNSLQAAFFLQGLAQVGGVTMVVLGLVLKRKVPAPITAIVPYSAGGQTGAYVLGEF